MKFASKIFILFISIWTISLSLSAQSAELREGVISVDSINQKSQPVAANDTITLDEKKILSDKLPKEDIKTIKPFIPDPTRAVWYSALFPGLGQIYNRKYWKLPIVYGGFAATFYAYNWNSQFLKDYSQAYLDIMDNDPNTKSYEDIVPPSMLNSYNQDQLKNILKRQKDMFRRNRDLSVISMLGVYLLSVLDAYVDAQLFDFDINPDISMRVEPTIIMPEKSAPQGVGISWSLRF
ncbi:MAG: DUF5683 domain-containing protein [Bacteroidales bacterium]